MAGEDRLRELEEKYEGYKVYDNNGESIGKVDDLFVDDRDREEYIGVKMGLFGLSGMTLIPIEIARVNEQDRVIEVAESKQRVKDAPQYNDDDEIDRSFEERIRQHFDLGNRVRGDSYDRPTEDAEAEGAAAAYNTRGDDDQGMTGGGSREPMGREEYRNRDDYASDSAMASAAGGATASGGVSDFETGDREGRGDYREGERQDYYQDYQDDRPGYRQDDREGGATSTGGEEEARTGGEDTGDVRYRDAYLEGYRQAVRDSSGQGGDLSASTASGEGRGERSDNREGAGEYVGATTDGPGERDYESESAGYQQDRGGEGTEYEGRTRVRRLRRRS